MRHTLRPVLFKMRRCLFVVAAATAIGSTAIAFTPPLSPGISMYNPALNPPFSFFTPSYVSGPLATAPVTNPYNNFVTSNDFPYNYDGTLNNAFAGFVESSVWKNAVGQLAFEYVFNNLTPPAPQNPQLTDIVRATINDPSDPWFNPMFDEPVTIYAAGSDPNSGGHSTPINGFFGGWNNGLPFDITRSATDYGVSVEFNPLNSGTQLDSTPNDQSATVWFATDAMTFNITNVSLSDNGHVGTSFAFAPGPPPIICPEPATFVLTIIGCCGGGIAVRRSRIVRKRGRAKT